MSTTLVCPCCNALLALTPVTITAEPPAVEYHISSEMWEV